MLNGVGTEEGQDIAHLLTGAVGPQGVMETVHRLVQGRVLVVDSLVAHTEIVGEFAEGHGPLRSGR